MGALGAKTSAYSCKSYPMASTSALFQRNSFRRGGLRRERGGGRERRVIENNVMVSIHKGG